MFLGTSWIIQLNKVHRKGRSNKLGNTEVQGKLADGWADSPDIHFCCTEDGVQSVVNNLDPPVHT